MSTLNQGIAGKTSITVLASLGAFHLCNDALQSLVQAVYPIIHDTFSLSLGSIGIITLVYQIAASIFQPLVGWYADRRPQVYALPFAMGHIADVHGIEYVYRLCSYLPLLGIFTVFLPNLRKVRKLSDKNDDS